MNFRAIMIFFITLLFCFPAGNNIKAQTTPNPGDTIKNSNYYRFIDSEDYNSDVLNELLRHEINKYRNKNRLDTLSTQLIFQNAAEDQAKYMANAFNLTYSQGGKKKDTGMRLTYFGGSANGTELIIRMPTKKGTELFTYGKVVDDIMFKWLSDKKGLQVLNDPRFVFIGLGSALEEDGRKVYLSAVFGNFSIYNSGAVRIKELALPFTTKKYGLKKYDEKACKRCEKFRNIEELHRGIFVKDEKIYFKHDNIKTLKKLFKDPGDGIVIDIIQKNQFTCDGDNIVNNNLVNKGVMLKRFKPVSFDKKNLIDKKEKSKKVEVLLGSLPKGLSSGYEINMLIIIGKTVCRTIAPNYSETGGVEYENVMELLADTIVTNETEYRPVVESSDLEFIVPFEKSKFEYKKEDIDPIISKLNEPDFVIKNLSISAYSSIEGSDETNKVLQKKRAESIVEALKSRQKNKFTFNISMGDNIDDFKRDVAGTEFSSLAEMTVEQVQDYITKNDLSKKLEPILARHRYAKISMNVTFDISGKNEQLYVLSRFKKCIADNNLTKALAIQKFIFKKVLKKEYTAEAVTLQNILETPELAGMLMNKLWLEKYTANQEITEEICSRIFKLNKLSPGNPYITYNCYYCKILHDEFDNDKEIADFQKEVSSLYATPLSKKTVDRLNMELQLKIIQFLDTTLEPHPMMLASLDTIRAISRLTEANWQNSLKLAYIFINLKDYEFAAKLIEPYITNKNPFDELIFTYIAICSNLPYKFSSPKFTFAMNKAAELDKERYCKLIGKGKLSIQCLENTFVKDTYCKTCKN